LRLSTSPMPPLCFAASYPAFAAPFSAGQLFSIAELAEIWPAVTKTEAVKLAETKPAVVLLHAPLQLALIVLWRVGSGAVEGAPPHGARSSGERELEQEEWVGSSAKLA